jgi:hypothetical protein
MYMYMYTYVCVCVYIYIYIYILNTHIHARIYADILPCMCSWRGMSRTLSCRASRHAIHAHTRIYTQTHIYTHTYMQASCDGCATGGACPVCCHADDTTRIKTCHTCSYTQTYAQTYTQRNTHTRTYMQASCDGCATGGTCPGCCHADGTTGIKTCYTCSYTNMYTQTHTHICKHTYIHIHICRHRAMDVPREGHVQDVAIKMTLQESRHAVHAHTRIYTQTHTHVIYTGIVRWMCHGRDMSRVLPCRWHYRNQDMHMPVYGHNSVYYSGCASDNWVGIAEFYAERRDRYMCVCVYVCTHTHTHCIHTDIHTCATYTHVYAHKHMHKYTIEQLLEPMPTHAYYIQTYKYTCINI